MRKLSKTATIGSIALMSAVFVAGAISTNVKVRDTSDEKIYFVSGEDMDSDVDMESLAALSAQQYGSYAAQGDKYLGGIEDTQEDNVDAKTDEDANVAAKGTEDDAAAEDKEEAKDTVEAQDTEKAEDTVEAQDTEEVRTEEPEEKSEYDTVAISMANPYVNVRDDASEDAQILGKLYNGSIGEIVGDKGEWVKIKSGNVTGYVKSEYIISGKEAEKVYDNYTTKVATVTTETLRVRSDATTDSSIVTQVAGGEKYDVLGEKDGWVKIDAKGDVGYVSGDYLSFSYNYNTAISIEEERKAEEEARKAEEEALRKEAEEKAAREKAEKEAKEKAAREAAAKAAQEKANNTSTQTVNKPQTVTTSGMSYTEDDLKLLACLVYTEAGGESYEAQLAVANVVLNRKKSSSYPNTISGVIYQAGQFGPARNGSLARRLNNYTASGNAYRAAKAALEGTNNIGDRIGFNLASQTPAHSNDVIIGVIRFF